MKKLLTVLFASMVIFSLAMPVFAHEGASQTATTKTKKTKATKARKVPMTKKVK
jgi:hypothetical protein